MKKVMIPVKLHQQYVGTVEEVRYSGQGVINLNDYEVLVPNAFEGEEIRYEITQVNRYFSRATLIEVIKASKNRIDSDHAYLLEVGIAPYINMSYAGQLALKRQQIKRLYAKEQIEVEVAPTIGMDEPHHYRNKTIVPLQYIEGHLLTGFIRRRTRGEIVPLNDYYVNDPEIDRTIGLVREVLDKHHISVYMDDEHKGEFRYIMVRRGYYSGEIMVVLVTQSPSFTNEAGVVADIVKNVPGLKSLILNHNPRKLHAQLSGDNRTLWGKNSISDTLLGIEFNIGPNSFYQVNPQTTEVLYELAAQKAELKPSDTVIDAYSGIGTIGLTVASKVKAVLGVEIVERAVADAQENKAQNHITNANFEVGDAPAKMQEWAKAGMPADVIFVDPPRKGLTIELMDAVIMMRPSRFVYVSCNPESAARDARYLLDHGYHLKGDILPVDQFPQTAHVESIAVFEPNK
ncbi:23S rRNA (uracil-C(5))-methyltransferase [Weissella oryzae SG25]|uniref:23S rRNA (Uracil-C(5))-methyltransferase n=1 Tax=Weissella oryzae (strain DSM 25784 / JCM 18191 / LMG 30913 / SG25) TaxID=1329250 RepID=A0A069CT14_WEIOS|nr:23S rRNA (uracil(1939)-C(5))-methyltransferase RlmD [Weissella oryzae]GAK30955.1 23S rRNA (uracil-C(5))-methyltransferase [Weissella oryzae SG25]